MPKHLSSPSSGFPSLQGDAARVLWKLQNGEVDCTGWGESVQVFSQLLPSAKPVAIARENLAAQCSKGLENYHKHIGKKNPPKLSNDLK